MRQVYKDVITSPFRAPLPTDAESEARTETFLIELGIDPAHARWLVAQGEDIDPGAHYQWLLAHGEVADCPPPDAPESLKVTNAELAELMAKAPKAYFHEGEGIWLQYPGAHRQVRAGDAREGDPKPKPEALALKQASYRTTRKLRRKGGTGAS